MSFDIYGNKLKSGHCEVHPWMACEYPCPICIEERKTLDGIDNNSLSHEIHESIMALADLRDQVANLRNRLLAIESALALEKGCSK